MAALEVRNLSKRYGRTVAVDDLSFAVEAGRVTGFLGPNGAGKTTTMRALLGLLRPSGGTALVEGERPASMEDPLRTIGAALEATAFHPGRSGRNHLRTLAAAGRIGRGRVEEVLEMVELSGAADRRVKGYSLGMRQRLALAAALLGEPRILILDEPANGLDPQGMRWLRDLLRAQAAAGRTVLISSHVLSEVDQVADELVVIRHGKLVSQSTLEEFTRSGVVPSRVRASDAERLATALRERGGRVEPDEGALLVSGLSGEEIGELARDLSLAIHELAPQRSSLEERFLELTSDEGAAPDGDAAGGEGAAPGEEGTA
jgi:ABC-2 type transport system ATP-binding protein